MTAGARGGGGVLPGHVAAEQEAEHEDEEADAQDDDVDVEGQVEELLRRHAAGQAEDLEDRDTRRTRQSWSRRRDEKLLLPR